MNEVVTKFQKLWKKHPKIVICVAAGVLIGIVVGIVALPLTLGAVGLGAIGPVAGGAFAGVQAAGWVTAGSLCATVQSIAMGGSVTIAALTMAGAAVTGGVSFGALGALLGKRFEQSRNDGERLDAILDEIAELNFELSV